MKQTIPIPMTGYNFRGYHFFNPYQYKDTCWAVMIPGNEKFAWVTNVPRDETVNDFVRALNYFGRNTTIESKYEEFSIEGMLSLLELQETA